MPSSTRSTTTTTKSSSPQKIRSTSGSPRTSSTNSTTTSTRSTPNSGIHSRKNNPPSTPRALRTSSNSKSLTSPTPSSVPPPLPHLSRVLLLPHPYHLQTQEHWLQRHQANSPRNLRFRTRLGHPQCSNLLHDPKLKVAAGTRKI